MHTELGDIEARISTLEKTASKFTEITFFEEAIGLYKRASALWSLAEPDAPDTPASIALRDRITRAEERIANLVKRVPAYTIYDIRLKFELMMLNLHPNVSLEDESLDDPSCFMTSLFRDISKHEQFCYLQTFNGPRTVNSNG